MKRMTVLAFLVLTVALGASTRGEEQKSSFAGEAPKTPVVVRAVDTPNTYGETNESSVVLGAAMFGGKSSSVTWVGVLGNDRYITSGALDSNPMLPNGTLITRIEIAGCDTSATDSIHLDFGACNAPGAACALVGSVDTGGAAVRGCGFFSSTLANPLQVDNANTVLLAEVSTGASPATVFDAVRIYYVLQISPPPGVATFNDVPTSDFGFQFVEAFRAAGLTAGCTGNPGFQPPVYCPDRSVTRRELAIFFAKALGLHFPN